MSCDVNEDNLEEKCAQEHAENAYKFYRDVLGSPRFVVAPMVDASELAWRLLSKRYGAQLVYTPMMHAATFVRDPRYRRHMLVTNAADKPLIAQFCANDPEIFAAAGRLAQDSCAAIDLNLGCPQSIAKRGHYGAFLQEDVQLITDMIRRCVAAVSVPVTAKIRVLESEASTVAYAQALERAGASILTVHGRTRDQKGVLTGLADWGLIRAVKRAVKIPVFANGNIQYLSDVHRCLAETGVDGVMTAEGNLHNPALFSGELTPVWRMAEEYLAIVRNHPCPLSYSRSHVFKLFHHAMHHHPHLRETIGSAKNLDALEAAVREMKELCLTASKLHEDTPSDDNFKAVFNVLPHPYWLCQPYVRPPPAKPDAHNGLADLENAKEEESFSVSQAKALCEYRKRRREAVKVQRAERQEKRLRSMAENPRQICAAENCGNVGSSRCPFDLCRHCCSRRSRSEAGKCELHDTSRRKKKKAPEENQPEESPETFEESIL